MANSESGYKVTLYTYHGCPYAHRVHIALGELGVQYEEVTIDLDKPREPWYLQINPVSQSCPTIALRTSPQQSYVATISVKTKTN